MRSRSRTSPRAEARAAGNRATTRRRWDFPGCTGTTPRSASTPRREPRRDRAESGCPRWCSGTPARRRPARPRLRRSGRTDSASATSGLSRGASSRVDTTACTNENSASRVPLTGNTIVSGMHPDVETPLEPGRARRARFRQPGGRRITVEFSEFAAQRVDDERRRRVFGLADRHRDVRQACGRRDARLQTRQSFERVGGE